MNLRVFLTVRIFRLKKMVDKKQLLIFLLAIMGSMITASSSFAQDDDLMQDEDPAQVEEGAMEGGINFFANDQSGLSTSNRNPSLPSRAGPLDQTLLASPRCSDVYEFRAPSGDRLC